jgi:hypothetical protein
VCAIVEIAQSALRRAMKSHQPIESPLTRLSRPVRLRRSFGSSSVARFRSETPALAADGLEEWLSSRGDQLVRQLAKWQAPALPDQVLDTLATIFLMQPGHELTPFFVWLEHRLRRSADDVR